MDSLICSGLVNNNAVSGFGEIRGTPMNLQYDHSFLFDLTRKFDAY